MDVDEDGINSFLFTFAVLACRHRRAIKMPETKSAIYLSLTLSFNLPSACEEISLQLLAYLRAHLIAGLFGAKCDWRNTNCSGPEISSETFFPPPTVNR